MAYFGSRLVVDTIANPATVLVTWYVDDILVSEENHLTTSSTWNERVQVTAIVTNSQGARNVTCDLHLFNGELV